MLLKSLLLVAAAGIGLVLVTTAMSDTDRDHARSVERGRYLVTAMGCNDCHTPLKLGPNGPEPDMTRMLSGHPAEMALPPAPGLPEGPWNTVAAGTLTAWNGPWGTSFTANLTPDPETGIGRWKEADFAATVRTGRHLGRGRNLLPPMPYQNVAALTDADLHDVFTYLQSIPAIANRVPQPLPPARQ
ncbi:MAG: diheme cytochrome c-553 [Planctomycetes bacterium]|nr:diheme cytochrome c-553 [Planctomycetota bacterium]